MNSLGKLLIFLTILVIFTGVVSAVEFSTEQVVNASGNVNSYVETNHSLPSSVNVSGSQVNTAQYLYISNKAILNINSNSNSSINSNSYNLPSNPSEDIHAGYMGKSEYLQIANDIKNYMDGSGCAPNYAYQTSLGTHMRFETLVYMYSQILNSYKINGILPDLITVNQWSVVANSNTKFLAMDQITNASSRVNAYLEANHTLPSTVNISGTQLNMAQFLKLSTTTLLNVNGHLSASILSNTFNSPTNPSEDIHAGNMGKSEYLQVANDIKNYMDSSGCAPNYAYQTSLGTHMRFETLVYMYSQILNSYRINGVLPDLVAVNQWAVVTNTNSKFFTMDQVINSSDVVRSYVEANRALPSSVNIFGTHVNMAQFLKLSTTTLLNVNGHLSASILSNTFNSPTNPSEDIHAGNMGKSEYLQVANDIKNYMDGSGCAPNYAYQTSLGTHMRFETLVYMYSQILRQYNINQTLSGSVIVNPWLDVINPNVIYNFRTGEMFFSIQAAINDADTQNGDTISLGKTSYTENVVMNKTLNITSSGSSTVNAANASIPVFIINSGGNGSSIMNLIIKGSTGNAGIYINNSNNNTLYQNNITGNLNGVYLNHSSGTFVSGNTIINNTANGIYVNTGYNNTIYQNILKYNTLDGIYINNSPDNQLLSNSITNNLQDGIYLYNSPTEVHFNQILANTRYGIFNNGNGTVNATNNWWGSNNSPSVPLNNHGDICVGGGVVNSTTWLVLTAESTPDTISGRESVITADLTRNNNNDDTSSSGHFPDGVPVNFTTNLGAVTTTTYTRNGKASSVLRFNETLQSGTTTVTAGLNNQNSTVNVTKIPANITITITSTALDPTNYYYVYDEYGYYIKYRPLNYTKVISLNSSLDAVSLIFRAGNSPQTNNSALEIMVNGQVNTTVAFFNEFSRKSPLFWYLLDPNVTLDNNTFFYIRMLNYYLPKSPQEENDSQVIANVQSVLYIISQDPTINQNEFNFIINYSTLFMDKMNITVTYPGGSINKIEYISYLDGPDAEFETLQTFAIATGKVTDNMVQYWLNQKNATVNGTSLYPVGYKKAAYGTFMTALTTLWLSDKLADEMASCLEVTWGRGVPAVVMSGVNGNGAYVSCLDPGMGMSVNGTMGNVISFRFMSSLMLSDLEQAALGNAGLNGTSTISEIVIGILNGKHLQVIFDEANETVTLIFNDNPNLKIVIDLATGLVKDIVDDGSFQYKGSIASDDAYCYHQQRTDRLTKGISDFLNSPEGQHNVASLSGSMLIALGLVALGPAGWAVGGAIIIGGVLLTAYGSGVLEDPGDYRNWLDFGVSIGLSCLGPEAVGVKTAVSASYRSTVQYCVGQRGSRVIAEEAWLGRDGAVSTCDYIRQQAIGVDSSYIIHQLPSYN